jgi:hypothetical protein
MEMRLSAEAITEAFEVTGMQPITRNFGDKERGCGMQAYARAHEEYKGRPANVSLLATGRPYFEGFTTGWDGYQALPEERLMKQYGGIQGMFRYLDGLEDGKAAASRVFERAELREIVTV